MRSAPDEANKFYLEQADQLRLSLRLMNKFIVGSYVALMILLLSLYLVLLNNNSGNNNSDNRLFTGISVLLFFVTAGITAGIILFKKKLNFIALKAIDRNQMVNESMILVNDSMSTVLEKAFQNLKNDSCQLESLYDEDSEDIPVNNEIREGNFFNLFKTEDRWDFKTCKNCYNQIEMTLVHCPKCGHSDFPLLPN